MSKVYTKLLKVQQGLKAPKGQFNSFGNYYYRNLEDILEALKPLLNEVKAVVLIEDEIVQIGDRFYVKATAKFVDAESGDIITNTALARESFEKKGMDPSQLTGATSSYARKYAMNGLFAIDDTKDADNMDNRSIGQAKPVNNQQSRYKAAANANYKCSSCDDNMPQKVYEYSMSKYNKPLCFACQQGVK